jgi:glycine hydroxymethyltransferase
MDIESEINFFLRSIKKHEFLRKTEAINLVASENRPSPIINQLRSLDLDSRYTSDLYSGTSFIRSLISQVESFAKKLFSAEFVNVFPISGNITNLAFSLGLSSPGDKIAMLSNKLGGYPLNLDHFNRERVALPFNPSSASINLPEFNNMLSSYNPKIIVLGHSVMTFPLDVNSIASAVHDQDNYCVYDGSHVLGLISGKQFQQPLTEGADLLVGSTHKSFPGPQGGIILSNSEEVFKKVNKLLVPHGSEGIVLVDNPHPGRIAALGASLIEMLAFGEAYAKQIIANSKYLAKSLDNEGVPVKFAHLGYSESHQVLLDLPLEICSHQKSRLERANLFSDVILRFGTSEITRLGMKEEDMKTIAHLIKRIIVDDESPKTVKEDVKLLAKSFKEVHYTFDEWNEELELGPP